MTHEELIEKVARAIHAADDVDETYNEMKSFFNCLAQAAISTILDALQEPTEEMIKAGSELFCQSYEAPHIWQDMLDASPLAPEKTE